MLSLRLSVVIPTRDTLDLTVRCLEAVLSGGPDEVILVDDGGRDGTAELVARRFTEVRLLRVSEPGGFAVAANLGLSEARGELLLLLNSDTEVHPNALDELRRAMETDASLGIVGASLSFPDGTPQWSGGREPTLLWLFGLASGIPGLLARVPGYRLLRPVSGSRAREGSIDWVSGAAMTIRREVWEQCGPLDEGFRFYCQDLDFCLQARDAGWDICILQAFRVAHHGGATIGRLNRPTASHDPLLLWGDLMRWSEKRHGSRWARKAGWALRTGGRLRVLGRQLRGALMPAGARAEWRRGTQAYSLALQSISRAGREETT